MLVSQIIELLKEQNIEHVFSGDQTAKIQQVASLDEAEFGEVSFLNDNKFLPHLTTTKASLVIVRSDVDVETIPAVIKTDNPYYVYALIAQYLNPVSLLPKGIANTAFVDESAILSSSTSIDHNVVIKANVCIGESTDIHANSVIEQDVKIGNGCKIAANVTIMHGCVIGDNTTIESGSVIGGDGFGWANNQGQWVKIPQVGKVIIGNHVSIGNNVCIDRGAIKDTVISDNCIIDNQVHIAHNCHIGFGSAIAGQTGFAGSTVLGKYCTVAGQVGFSGHINITDNCHFLAKTGVTHDLKEPGAYAGFPAVKASEWQKTSVRVRQLDKISKKIKQLEKELASLRS